MTQLKCPECGKEITTQTETCPNCGCPVSLMASVINEKRSTQQKRMVALALPIGIMAIISVLFDIFDFFKLPESMETLSKIRYGGDLLIVFVLFSLMMAWFLTLFKGSTNKSKMRTISAIALIGIIMFLLFNVIVIVIFIRCDLLRNEYPNWWWGNLGMNLAFSLRYILFGSAFCAIGKYFHRKMNAYAILIGIGFLFRWVLMVVSSLVYIRSLVYISQCLIILSYLFMALFFFEFRKTNKS